MQSWWVGGVVVSGLSQHAGQNLSITKAVFHSSPQREAKPLHGNSMCVK
jgi:hypothetical protein